MSIFLMFALIVALISGIPRRFGASRWLSFLIPIVPLFGWLIYSLVTHEGYADEGGAMAVWMFVIMLLAVALPVSAITVFMVPRRNGKSSA